MPSMKSKWLHPFSWNQVDKTLLTLQHIVSKVPDKWNLNLKTLAVRWAIVLCDGSESPHRLSKYLLGVCMYVRAQSCLTLCNPMDCSPLGSSVHGTSQARIPEWVAISFSRWSSWPRDWTWVSCISCLSRWIHYHCTTWEAVFTQQFSKNQGCDGKTRQNTSLETSPEAASCAVEQKHQAQLQLLCSYEPGRPHRQHETSECGYGCCPSPWGRAPGSPPFLSVRSSGNFDIQKLQDNFRKMVMNTVMPGLWMWLTFCGTNVSFVP